MAKTTEKAAKQEAQKKTTIKMTRSVEDAQGGSTEKAAKLEADVHPEEIENYKKGGWKAEE